MTPTGRTRLMLAAAGYLAARAGHAIASDPAGGRRANSERINYRGRRVSLAAGPALTVAAGTTAAWGAARAGRRDLAAAALLAGLAAGAVGRYDDLVGGTDKGLRGHLGALRRGQVTGGTVKLVGLAAAATVAATILSRPTTGRPGQPGRWGRGTRGWGTRGWGAGGWGTRGRGRGRAVEIAVGAGVIAGSANLANLLDLRPGRALKASLLLAVPLMAGHTRAGPGGAMLAGPVGAVAALLGADLAERTMLGDCGANALGAIWGVAAVDRTGLVGRCLLLAGLVGLTVASERVSFSAVIESTPVLREWDRLGRR